MVYHNNIQWQHHQDQTRTSTFHRWWTLDILTSPTTLTVMVLSRLLTIKHQSKIGWVYTNNNSLQCTLMGTLEHQRWVWESLFSTDKDRSRTIIQHSRIFRQWWHLIGLCNNLRWRCQRLSLRYLSRAGTFQIWVCWQPASLTIRIWKRYAS